MVRGRVLGTCMLSLQQGADGEGDVSWARVR